MRYYTSTAVPTSLVGSISSTATSFTVAALNGYPSSFPFTVALDPDTDNEELISVTGITGLVVTCTRGFAGTTAIGHGAGAGFEHRTSHLDYQEPQNHIAANNGVHGVTGNVVGTTDAQTLTNKTIDGNSNTLTNVPSSAVVGLAASLAGKLDDPSTPWAQGALLMGTGTGVYDAFPAGAQGTVLTVQPDGTVAWATGPASAWQTYTPTLSGSGGGTVSVGNGTLSGRYAQNGKTVTVSVRWQAGLTTSVSGVSGNAQVSLPVPPAASAFSTGPCQTLDSTANTNLPSAAVVTAGSPVVTLWQVNSTAGAAPISAGSLATTSSNTQAVRGSGNWTFTLTYEAA